MANQGSSVGMIVKRPSLVAKLRGLFWIVVALGLAAVAAAWWRSSPGGFPPSSPRFWSNQILPPALLLLSAASLLAVLRGRTILLQALLPMYPAMFAAMAATGWLLFPASRKLPWIPPLAASAIMILMLHRRHPTQPRRLLVRCAMIALAAFAGVFIPLSQRASLPATMPLNTPIPASAAGGDTPQALVQIGHFAVLDPNPGLLYLQHAPYRMALRPLLTFHSRSPDRFWTLFAEPPDRIGPPRQLLSLDRSPQGASAIYRDDDVSTLRIATEDDNLQVEACSRLPAAVYSHLNSWCEVEISGHERLQLAFSPCPQSKIPVLPADYPTGRPARSAYLDAGGIFHVVEASSGEKGPFRELAAGPLPRSQPLAITFYDGDRAICRLVLEDYAAQAGVALSPTAGWGLAVNAIEFSLTADPPSSAAVIYMTLAGTSVGRGYDSVGHAPGTYRNRMRIEWLSRP